MRPGTRISRRTSVFADAFAKDPTATLDEYFDLKLPGDVPLSTVLDDPQNAALLRPGGGM